MDRSQTKFSSDLERDLQQLLADGFQPPLEPSLLPALAEVAWCLNPEAETDADAVEAALHLAIGRSTQNLLACIRVPKPQLVEGVSELLGITGNLDQGLEARRELAGPLLGYPNGNDGLRKAERKRRPLVAVILEELSDQLSLLAAAANFVYMERFVADQDRALLLIAKEDPRLALLDLYLETAPSNEAGRDDLASLLARAFELDVYELYRVGFQVATAAPYAIVKELSTLALTCVAQLVPRVSPRPGIGRVVEWNLGRHPANVTPEELEVLLTWVSSRLDTAARGEALADLWGIGRIQGLTKAQRRQRALDRLGHGEAPPKTQTVLIDSLLRDAIGALVSLGQASEFKELFAEPLPARPSPSGLAFVRNVLHNR